MQEGSLRDIMNADIVKALTIKEIKQIKRDPSSILVAFVMPLIILIIFGYGISFNIENIKIDLVQQDSGKIARDLEDLYAHSKYFSANVIRSTQEAMGNMESGKTQGTIIIPQHFSEKVQRGLKSEVQIISDGTDPNTSAYIEGYAMGVFTKYLKSLAKSSGPEVNLIQRLWFNPTAESINFLMAGALTMILAIVGTLLTSLVVAKEWEKGTMEALISTTVSIVEIIVSKLIPYFCLCIVSLAISLAYGIYVFRMPFEGSIFAIALVASVFVTVSLLIGLLISTCAKDQFVAAMGSVTITFMPTMLLSGFIFEIKSMPLWLQGFTFVFPARYFVSSMRTLCLVGDVWEILLKDISVLLIMAGLLFLALEKKLKKNVE
ncbi:MAG: ABC transporter permease [Holosporales bacterium]|jgi:ABC-2 type transport system permease protein|nr:ABC transporter permease [Holosporales bacterium]